MTGSKTPHLSLHTDPHLVNCIHSQTDEKNKPSTYHTNWSPRQPTVVRFFLTRQKSSGCSLPLWVEPSHVLYKILASVEGSGWALHCPVRENWSYDVGSLLRRDKWREWVSGERRIHAIDFCLVRASLPLSLVGVCRLIHHPMNRSYCPHH